MSKVFHFFDMDFTLIENDCDVSWRQFLVAKKLAPLSDLELNDKFFDDYNAGCLDIEAFSKFQLKEFANKTYEEMHELAVEHFEEVVKSRIRPKAFDYVQEAISRGEHTFIVTSTNQILAEPVGAYFNVEGVYGAQLEMVNNLFTGKTAGTFTAGNGKVAVIKALQEKYDFDIAYTNAYGDSVNDVPMLEFVANAFAISPSTALRELTVKKQEAKFNWTILDWSL